MKKQIRLLLTIAVGMSLLGAAAAAASSFDKAVSNAMHTLSVVKDDAQLLLMTDAPYVVIDGASSLPFLEHVQNMTGCTVGRGNLLFFQRPQPHPLRFMLFKKPSGHAVIINRNGDTWQNEVLLLSTATVCHPDFRERIAGFLAGMDLFTLGTVANVWAQGVPYDFLKCAELHNHICPGMTSGYLIGHYILKHYPLAEDERYTFVSCPVWCKEDALQVLLDCTPGKKGMIVKPISSEQKKAITVPDPAGMLLLWNPKKKSGRGVALSFDFERLRAVSPTNATKPAWVLAATDYLGKPERFVSAAAEFDLNEQIYFAIVQAGNNPYQVVGLVRD